MLKLLAILLLAQSSPTLYSMSKKAASPPAPEAQVPVPTAPDQIWVGKSDNAKSCAANPGDRGVELDLMAAQLHDAKIQILAKKKLHDHKMRIQMCGTDKGDLNGFLISRKDLEKAKELGFDPLQPHP